MLFAALLAVAAAADPRTGGRNGGYSIVQYYTTDTLPDTILNCIVSYHSATFRDLPSNCGT